MGEPTSARQRTLYSLVRHLHDCLAAQTNWSHDVNVLAQQEISLVPLTRRQQEQLGASGSLALSSREAMDLSDRFATAGSELSLRLGALFLVGRLPSSDARPPRSICAPLLEVPLRLSRDLSQGQVTFEPDEDEFSVNYSLVSEILRTSRDDLQDRLADLADLVPDFPINPDEFREFWNGFRMVASGLPLVDELPKARRKKQATSSQGSAPSATKSSSDAKPEMGRSDSASSDDQPSRVESVDEPQPLQFIDFYLPQIAGDGQFRLLPATTIILGKRPGHVFSALRELDAMTRLPIDHTALSTVFGIDSTSFDETEAETDIASQVERSGEAMGAVDAHRPAQNSQQMSVGNQHGENQATDEVLLPLRDAHPLPLTATQRAVVSSARHAPLTVVTGPPGTGKSYTITAIVLDAILAGRSVLVASQMDKAVEVVAEQVERIAGPYAIARSGGRRAQRALAEKIDHLTGPKTEAQQLAAGSRDDRKRSVRRHSQLTERLATLDERYRSVIEKERLWHESHDSCQRLRPICPLPIHEISAEAYRRAKAAVRRARQAADKEPGPIRLPVRGVSLRTFVRARQALRTAQAWLDDKPGFITRWRAERLKRQAMELFGAQAPQSLSCADVEQALQQWWAKWNEQRALESLKIKDDWACTLDEIWEAIVVHGHLVTMREAERELRAPFPADLLWQEIEDVEQERNDAALKLLRLNREATLHTLTRSDCHVCHGEGKIECPECGGSGRVRRRCPGCKGLGQREGLCRRCGGFGWTPLDFGKCRACAGTGRTAVCSQCHGAGSIEATKKCPDCRGRAKKRCAACGGKGKGIGRTQLRLFARLLRRRNRKLKRQLREKLDLSIPLSAFPGWASTNRALGEILPANPGMFDLVVIDEASQCDLATAAVAVFRGKRAVIVGDPHQLRHVSFLSKAREEASFSEHGLDTHWQHRFRYRRSLFDVAADAVPQEQFFLLDQHFRSDPHIIDFSNREFYEGRLRIMTQRPRARPHSAIRCRYVAGRRSAGSSVNPCEVEAVLSEASVVLDAPHQREQPLSLGIVSPFRDHVDAIWEQLLRRFSANILQEHAVVVGTAHSLQGDEKDIVIFSTSIDTDCHFASLRFLENPHLFNVAITRARQQLVVVTSVTMDDLPAGLLRDFLQHTQSCQRPYVGEEQHVNDFSREVASELRKQQLHVWPNYRSAGVQIDIVAANEAQHAAVLCDGPAPRDEASIDPLTCHRLLARAGWNVRRIPRRTWLANWYECFHHIETALGG